MNRPKPVRVPIVLLLAFHIAGVSAASADTAPGDVGERIRAIDKRFQAQVAKATNPIRSRQVVELSALKESLVGEDRLEEALLVEAEIERLLSSIAASKLMLDLEGAWEFTTTRNRFDVASDGRVFAGDSDGVVRILDAERRIVQINAHRYQLAPDGRSLSGAGLPGGSRHPARKLR